MQWWQGNQCWHLEDQDIGVRQVLASNTRNPRSLVSLLQSHLLWELPLELFSNRCRIHHLFEFSKEYTQKIINNVDFMKESIERAREMKKERSVQILRRYFVVWTPFLHFMPLDW